MFKRCDQAHFKYLTSLLIDTCYSCTIENIAFVNLGLKGTNLLGRSHINEIVIKSDKLQPNILVFCQGIKLIYSEEQLDKSRKHLLIINHINITGEDTGNRCYNRDPIGINILISIIENLLIVINNSIFYNLHHTAISIRNQCLGNNTMIIENCTFEHSKNIYINEDFLVTIRPLIDIILSHNNKSISFITCSFNNNHGNLISTLVRESPICYAGVITNCNGILTNITFVKCQFTRNFGEIINIKGGTCKANLLIIGPSHFFKTTIYGYLYAYDHLIFTSYMVVNLIGPVVISSNLAINIMYFKSSEVLFHKNIMIKSNNCNQVISLQFTCIKVMEYSNITLLKNRYNYELIETEYSNDYKLYPLCIFQFVTQRNTTIISPTHYSIKIIDNLHVFKSKKKCSFPFYYFTPHCQWIPTAAFLNYSPQVVYQQIIKIHGENLTYHKICHCFKNGGHNCSVDTLGPVYPGQMLQLDLCTPCNDEPSILYAEVISIHLPKSICNVASCTQTNIIYNYSNPANFTIVSEATNTCELFLATSSYSHYINEAFYVELLPCPVGFTLQNGICNCDPVFSTYTDKCYIDYSAIQQYANTWITVYIQPNSTKYLISDCPMDYCLPYPSKLNLVYPDLQCQFKRTGLLCSQCQHHLSMVFGSSRCIECTNLHIIITIIVILVGVVLVVLMYLLNLTVTNGTISGIIFYANILSINDSVFLLNDNVFKSLKVFISFVNLDLGIETCFYNGMDSYAKMWLQLFFPFYLIVIAISVIIASRYSSRILRLTYKRSLPVLATLFLLSYNGVLRVVLTVLFSYSTITHLPSGHRQIVWSIDASIPLFGLKFTILFITCLVLFLLLIPFNIILLFTRYLSQFRVINHYKPLLDAFQGSYKDKYYYWVGVHITIRSLFFPCMYSR